MTGTRMAQGWHHIPAAVWRPLARRLVGWSECSEVLEGSGGACFLLRAGDGAGYLLEGGTWVWVVAFPWHVSVAFGSPVTMGTTGGPGWGRCRGWTMCGACREWGWSLWVGGHHAQPGCASGPSATAALAMVMSPRPLLRGTPRISLPGKHQLTIKSFISVF